MDAIVFPTINEVKTNFPPSKLKQGDLALNSSLFDDPFFPVGTREYEPGDQFHHIHWKASAKTQTITNKSFYTCGQCVCLICCKCRGKIQCCF